LGVAELSSSGLRRFIGRLEADGFSQARTRGVAKALRALLRYAAERGMVEWSAGSLLMFGDADEVPDPPPASPVATLAQGVLPHVEAAVYASAPASAPDTAAAPATSPRVIPAEAILALKIVTLVFVLVALMLVAESV
jgi:hypothetical protein